MPSSLTPSSPLRTRVKVCGLTRACDVQACLKHGVDALGFVLYEKSPRFVSLETLAALTQDLPPFVTPVLLFVNAKPQSVANALVVVPNALLQFHGDETPAECGNYQRPFIRAARIAPGFDLLQYAHDFKNASALLLDRYSSAYGGTGEVFDWSLLPSNAASTLVLSGGLSVQNVATGITKIRPFGVDVSSGVEQAKGIKDTKKIAAFIATVRKADHRLAHEADIRLT